MEVEEERRYIHLEIRRLEDELVIEMANSCEHLVDVGKLGELLFESTENEFVARILFHL